MSSKNKNTIKTLVRDVEKKSVNSKVSVLKSTFDNKMMDEDKFKDPEINSTKSILKQLKNIEEREYKKCGQEELNKNQKMGLNKKITTRMNFHIDDQVYKNLLTLNIGDIEAKSQAKKSLSTPKYVPKVTKDVEPNLRDFYKDEIKVDKPLLPPSVKVKHKPIIKYNSNDLVDKTLRWNL